jgi:D-amino peptidase
MTKIYMSTDMEGISGVVDFNDCQPAGRDYETGRKYMTEDINAAVRGAVAGGANEIMVNDAHGSMRNILPDSLDKRATLIRGKTKPLGMIEGLDKTFDAVICIGFHARSGELGILSHSFMGHEVEDIWLDGKPVGEIGLLHAAAASIGVPVIMLAGDDIACKEMREWDEHVELVSVKRSIDRFTAVLTPLEEARAAIELGTKNAVKKQARKPTRVQKTARLEVRWQSATVASHLCGIPGVLLKDSRTIQTQGAILDLYKQLFIFFKVAASLTNQPPYC